LALRNTLLFQWKNLRHPWHIARHLAALPVRLVYDACRAPWRPASARFMFARALIGALRKLPELQVSRCLAHPAPAAEREFFRRFAPSRMAMPAPSSSRKMTPQTQMQAVACEGARR
jgi:hypothetical protein